MIYELNKDNKIRVRTSVGDSEIRETGETVLQGLGSILTSLSLGKGVGDFFSAKNSEVMYDSSLLYTRTFQDDLLCISLDPSSTQDGLDAFESLAESKLLDFNLSKTFCIMIGEEKARN